MKYKLMVITIFFVLAALIGTPLTFAQDKIEEMDVDIKANESVMDVHYRKIAKRIIDKIISLREKYPHFAEVDKSAIIEEAEDKLWITFQYTHGMNMIPNPDYRPEKKGSKLKKNFSETDGIDLHIYFFKGPWEGQAAVRLQRIGEMNIVVFLEGGMLERGIDVDNVEAQIKEIIIAEKVSNFKRVVKNVIDGNTLVLDDGQVIRLIGVTIPDLNRENSDKNKKFAKEKSLDIVAINKFAYEAKEFLKDLVEGNIVYIKYEEKKDGSILRDENGRILAYGSYLIKHYEGPERGYIIPKFEARELNVKIILEGYAFADKQYPFFHMDRYVRLEEDARENHKGLWE